MTTEHIKRFLDRHEIKYNLGAVPQGVYGSGVMTKFWPHKLAGVLIYGETAGVRKLPGHLILAPMSVLAKICPTKAENIRAHLVDATNLGYFSSIEFYSNHALISVSYNAWELGVLDIDGRFAELNLPPVIRAPLGSPPTPSSIPYGTTRSPRKVGRPRSWVHVSELPEEYR